MAEAPRDFFVKDNKGRLVPATNLTDDRGVRIRNPAHTMPYKTKEGAEVYGKTEFLKAYDASGNPLADQSVMDYYVVPKGFNKQDFLTNAIQQSSDIETETGFWTGEGDFQHNYPGGGEDGGHFVKSFTDSNSFMLGQTEKLGVTKLQEDAGALNNLKGARNTTIDTSGRYGNPARNTVSTDEGRASFSKYDFSRTKKYIRDNIDNRLLQKHSSNDAPVNARRNQNNTMVTRGPDVLRSPDTPIAYNSVAILNPSKRLASSVFINGDPDFTLQSRSAYIKGHHPGTGKGVIVPGYQKYAHAQKGSSSVFSEGWSEVRDQDPAWINHDDIGPNEPRRVDVVAKINTFWPMNSA